ncbi:protein-L-isoaspartate O-methyltransferase [Plantactinospora sp. BB1]|uniref:protein-L-isoaspartate O-methyltransferase family protein n=1 Tax=Plantactinospora sp. BB1 TaxID=2071627 RepID=UPI000D1752C9|nr:methyltransferase domain-containing protein [Plantactinospora sp. BB1]AVT40444.1 methyltransferase [Plantactinospora sp. BB1]
MTSAAELRSRYVDQLRRDGLLDGADLLRAFGTVPREEFVAAGFDGGDGRWVGPADPDFLPLVYRNHPLVTKVVDGVPVSSSSQPSLMAAMIESLELRPGSRVLEIGVGTGYNAALMATMGARVTTVDIAPDVVERAGAALRRVGLADAVDVRLGDGYLGVPADAGYDRVVVTVGVTGVSPRWLDQLALDGYLLAPVEHAGNHPVLRIRPGGPGTGEARGELRAGFMSAAGPLAARYPGGHPAPQRSDTLPPPTVRHPPCWHPPLDVFRYHDLWFAVGAWDRRTTFSAGPPGGWGGPGGCLLLDEVHGGGAGLLPDGSVQAAGPSAARYAADALALRDRWVARGEPTICDWTAGLVPAGDPDQPILVPTGWVQR